VEDSNARRATRRLMFLFGALYFVQGIAEPTEGLISQPVRSLLRSWGLDASAMTRFMFFLGIPWYLKPVFGLLTDFVPIRGSRRKSWLVIWTAATSLFLMMLWLWPPAEGATRVLFVFLLIPCIGIAFTDVVIDGLMVEEGRPRGITGTLQSVQWACLYGAGIGTGWLGGWLSARGMQTTGFAVCAFAALFSLGVAVLMVKEPEVAPPEGTAKEAVSEMMQAVKHPAVLGVGAFLFLINFNPFGADVRYLQIVEELGLGEEAYGRMSSIQAIAAMVAAGTYGAICRKVPFRFLVHGCVLATVVATFFWWGLNDALSAGAIAAGYGFVMMLTTLVQLDMAARYCPPAIAATVFATLMALSNFAVSSSAVVGGKLYDVWGASMGRPRAFAILVGVGAAFTCLCWIVVPYLNRLEEE